MHRDLGEKVVMAVFQSYMDKWIKVIKPLWIIITPQRHCLRRWKKEKLLLVAQSDPTE